MQLECCFEAVTANDDVAAAAFVSAAAVAAAVAVADNAVCLLIYT